MLFGFLLSAVFFGVLRAAAVDPAADSALGHVYGSPGKNETFDYVVG